MIHIFSALKNLLQSKKLHIDHWAFRLHYRFTVLFLLLFCIVVSTKQYAGEPIKCSKDTREYSALVENYCFITSTYTVKTAFNKTLKYKDVTIPSITISRDDFPVLFEQCERFSVKDFDKTKDSVTLLPLEFTPKVVNILGHPSENVRSILISEVDHFNPENAEWKEPFEEPEPYKEFISSNYKFDRLCLHDLKARQEALRYKRKMLLDALQEKWSDSLIDQVRNLDAIQNSITKRIKEVDAICIEYSKRV